jgi:membrane metallo-endopeptidase-like protein 1
MVGGKKEFYGVTPHPAPRPTNPYAYVCDGGYKLWTEAAAQIGTHHQQLPGLEGFSDEQLLILGFARSFCSSSKQKAKEYMLKMDTHSPNHVRVNLALSNLPDFAKYFHCSPDSKMALKNKCSLW